MEKSERLRIFVGRLIEAEAVSTSPDARALLETELNRVEDQHSGTPYCQRAARVRQSNDGRMYPPADDFERESTAKYRRFRTRGNMVFYGINGSIRIENLHGIVLLDKAGADGRRLEEL